MELVRSISNSKNYFIEAEEMQGQNSEGHLVTDEGSIPTQKVILSNDGVRD